MKITAVETVAGGGSQARGSTFRSWVFVRIRTDDGIVGIGEGTAIGRGEAVMALVNSPDIAGYLVGQDPRRIEEHQKVMTTGSQRWRGGTVVGSALSAVDGALWDIVGQAIGAPVHRLLGGPVRTKVRVYAGLAGGAPADCAEEALALLAAGYTAMKLDPMGPLREPWLSETRSIQIAVERVAAIREAVGDRAEILIEGHGRMTPRMAVNLGRELEPFKPTFFEEPVPFEDVEAMAFVARNVRIPTAAGEHLWDRAMFRPYFEKGALKIAQPDLTKASGITECRKIGDMAAMYSVDIIPHNSGGPISTCMALQLGAVLLNFPMLELNTDEIPVWQEFLDEPLEVKDGYMDVPTRPGIGRDIKDELLAKRPFRAASSGTKWHFED